MSRLSLAFRQEKFTKMPLEIVFQPEESNTAYAIDGDYLWDEKAPNTGPFSFTAFTYRRNSENDPWQAAATSLSTLTPFGDWYLKIKNGGTRLNGQPIDPTAYQGLFSNVPARYGQNVLDLDGLLDALIVIAYEADTQYQYASL